MSATEHTDPKTGLLRAVSRWEIVALSVNDVIGSGVYLILPVAAASLLGPASVWAILAAGFAVLLLVLCFVEASSLFDEPGGAIVYTRVAFGDFVGFERVACEDLDIGAYEFAQFSRSLLGLDTLLQLDRA